VAEAFPGLQELFRFTWLQVFPPQSFTNVEVSLTPEKGLAGMMKSREDFISMRRKNFQIWFDYTCHNRVNRGTIYPN
jgi:hypothetical protein